MLKNEDLKSYWHYTSSHELESVIIIHELVIFCSVPMNTCTRYAICTLKAFKLIQLGPFRLSLTQAKYLLWRHTHSIGHASHKWPVLLYRCSQKQYDIGNHCYNSLKMNNLHQVQLFLRPNWHSSVHPSISHITIYGAKGDYTFYLQGKPNKLRERSSGGIYIHYRIPWNRHEVHHNM